MATQCSRSTFFGILFAPNLSDSDHQTVFSMILFNHKRSHQYDPTSTQVKLHMKALFSCNCNQILSFKFKSVARFSFEQIWWKFPSFQLKWALFRGAKVHAALHNWKQENFWSQAGSNDDYWWSLVAGIIWGQCLVAMAFDGIAQHHATWLVSVCTGR